MNFWLKISVLFAAGLALASPARADNYFPPNPYQHRFCAGLTEQLRPENASRTDCVSATHAIIVEYQDYWREAVGQAFAFAAERDLTPGIILVCRNDQGHCTTASTRIEAIFAHFGVPMTLWECSIVDVALADCRRLDCNPQGCV